MKIIDENIVKHVAGLSRLSLKETELPTYSKQLEAILEYINKLNELDTKNVQPTSHPVANLKNVFRKDKVGNSLPVDEALKNAPHRAQDFFAVPKIIE